MMSEKNFQLSIALTAKEINYEKPKHPNNFLEDSEYNKIDATIMDAVVLTNAGTTMVEEDSLPNLFAENKKDTRYIVDNKISDSQKMTIGNKNYIKSGAVLAEAHTRSEELPDATKRAKNGYVANSLLNISNSPEVKAQKGDFEDFAKKEERKLGSIRKKNNNISTDEVTGKPLKGNGDFHHSNKKTLHTDPVQRLNPDKGVVINDDTHRDIHKQNINDEKALADYIAKQGKEKQR